jgi:polyphosphate glucokinase
VKVVNDAAMQALGSYRGRNMLFLGLGTGLGNAMIREGTLIPMELGHLPYKSKTYEDYVGEAGLERYGKHAWRKEVETVINLFFAAFEIDYVVLGGGNVRLLKRLPPKCFAGSNANAFKGGFSLWK